MEPQAVASLIRARKVAMFCGAGISIGSGIPAANQLKRSLISSCTSEANHVEKILNSGTPLEAILEITSDYANLSTLLTLFEGGKPYLAHQLIGRLASKGLVKDVGTTNFDWHMERYLQEETGGRYCLCCSIPHVHDESLPLLHKLHGTVPDYKSIKVTVQQVASREVSAPIISSIRRIFSNGPHEYVLVLGYSFSDSFDINPILRSLNPRKKIIYIKHAGGEEKLQVLPDLPEPVKDYSGTTVITDTDWFLRQLWLQLEDQIGKPSQVPLSLETAWLDCVSKWRDEIAARPYSAFLIMGRLFSRIGDYGISDSYFQKVARATRETVPVSRSLFFLAGNRINGTRYQEAKDLADQGLSLLPDIEEMIGIGRVPDASVIQVAALGTAYAGAARMYLGQKIAREPSGSKMAAVEQYAEAEELFSQALRLSERIDGDVAFCTMALGATSMNHADCVTDISEKSVLLQRALEFYRRAFKIAVIKGAAYIQSDILDGFGKVFLRQDRAEVALRLHLSSLRIAEGLADERRESIKMLAVAADCQRLNGMQAMELEHRRRAQPLLLKLGDTGTAATNILRIRELEDGRA